MQRGGRGRRGRGRNPTPMSDRPAAEAGVSLAGAASCTAPHTRFSKVLNTLRSFAWRMFIRTQLDMNKCRGNRARDKPHNEIRESTTR